MNVSGLVTLFHTTPSEKVASILATGFRESLYREHVGVHLCSQEDQHFRANGRSPETVLAVRLPSAEVMEARLDPIQMPGCRDYIIPEDIVRAVGTISAHREVDGRPS